MLRPYWKRVWINPIAVRVCVRVNEWSLSEPPPALWAENERLAKTRREKKKNQILMLPTNPNKSSDIFFSADIISKCS